jgi:protein phosphatase 2C
MSSSEAGKQGHGVPALEAQASAEEHGVPALEAQDSTHDHGVPALDEAPSPADTDKILAAVAQLARRRRLEARRLGRTAPAGAEGEAPKRARPVSGTSADSSRESAKVAPEPQEGASAVVAPGPGWWPKSVSHGAMSVIGRRREMEDAFAVAAPFLVAAAAGKEESGEGEEKDGGGEAEVEFFAVYDGHGGSRVADACRERLHVVLAEEMARLHLHLGEKGGDDGEDGVRWREAMEACFARVDGEVVVVEREANKNNARDTMGCGSTAVVVVVGPRHIVVANCGDSRAVLSRGGVPVPLSSDHKVLTSVQHPHYPLRPKTKILPTCLPSGRGRRQADSSSSAPQIRIDFLESLAMRLRN